MNKTTSLFYLADIEKLIEEAKAADGTDLAIVVTSYTDGALPTLKVSYLKNTDKENNGEENHDTEPIEGFKCPFPPRCD